MAAETLPPNSLPCLTSNEFQKHIAAKHKTEMFSTQCLNTTELNHRYKNKPFTMKSQGINMTNKYTCVTLNIMINK